MRLALVTDTARVSRPAKRYLEETAASVAAVAGRDIEVSLIPAVPDHVGLGAPPISEVRAARDELLLRITDAEPDALVTLGAAAMNGVAGGKTALALKREHGRMRRTDGVPVPWTPTVDAWRVVRSPDLHRDLANVLYKTATQPEPLEPTVIETVVCRTAEDLETSLDALEGASVVGVDVETTGLSPHRDSLLAVGVGALYEDGTGLAVIVPRELLEDTATADALWNAVWRKTRRSVGHNFKFDMQFLERLVEWPPDGALLGDTLLLHHLLDERPNHPKSRARGSGLKDLVAQRYDHQYGFDFDDFYARAREDSDLWDAMHLYLGEDVVYTARLWLDLEREAREEGGRLMEVHDGLLQPVSRAIARCETAGAPVDLAWVRETMAWLERRIARRRAVLERSIARLAPTQTVTNVLSPEQVADCMYDEWDLQPNLKRHGKLDLSHSTDQDHVAAAVARYRRRGEPMFRQAGWLRSLVRLRKDARLVSVYQKQLLDRADDDGRVRPSFLLHGAATGRISAVSPAIQTIPAIDEKEPRGGQTRYHLRDGSWVTRPMRRAFAPREGRIWCEVDYSQLELRVAAAVSGDDEFARVFREGRDIHLEVASQVFSKEPADVSKAERYLAKAVSLGVLYGRSAKALAEGEEMDYAERELGMRRWDEATAQLFVTKFGRSYPTLAEWMVGQHRSVVADRYVESPYGRRRRFPLVTDHELGAIQRQSVNTPIQAAASDICLEAMVRVGRALGERGVDAEVLFPVHDSICIEAAEWEVLRVEEVCRSEMERDWHGVLLTIDFEYGSSWADVHA